VEVKKKLIDASPPEDLLAAHAVCGPLEKALCLRRTATAAALTSSTVSEARPPQPPPYEMGRATST
jgi:hypothetical protein